MNDGDQNPIASGIIALVAVAVVVGILGGIAALAGTRLIGIGGDSGISNAEPGAGESLYLPDPERTTQPPGPLVTLPGGATTTTETSTVEETETVSESPTVDEKRITLQSSTTEVGPGEELRLSGVYPRGEGAVLDIYYNVAGGGWDEFPLDVNVSGGIFEINVQTFKSGAIKWRVQDAAADLKSNEITVQHG